MGRVLLEFIVFPLLVGAVGYELWQYFREPVPPDERHLFDPERRPLNPEIERMIRNCQMEGKLAIAGQQDFGYWTYECYEDPRT